MAEMKRMGFATRAIHDGQAPDELTGAVNVPIYLTSTYQQEAIGKNKGHEYARLTNPTRDALEESLCSLEGGTSAHVFAQRDGCDYGDVHDDEVGRPCGVLGQCVWRDGAAVRQGDGELWADVYVCRYECGGECGGGDYVRRRSWCISRRRRIR